MNIHFKKQTDSIKKSKLLPRQYIEENYIGGIALSKGLINYSDKKGLFVLFVKQALLHLPNIRSDWENYLFIYSFFNGFTFKSPRFLKKKPLDNKKKKKEDNIESIYAKGLDLSEREIKLYIDKGFIKL